MSQQPGILAALAAALLFGIGTPLAKLMVGEVDPWLLAGMLYLGSGLGLGAVAAIGRRERGDIARGDRGWLAGAILAGGVAGPVLMMYGLHAAGAASSALLLNAEGVLTALIAWGVFRENAGRRVVLGMAAIVAGAVLLSWPGGQVEASAGAGLILAACLCWAIDNNLTRKVALADPVRIAALKGLAAGLTNVGLALGLGAPLPAPTTALLAGGLGFVAYGLSLVAFVVALRELGTARTGAYFSTAPFVGAALAVLALGEPLTLPLALAGLLMAFGVWLHLTERHDHEHRHEPIAHRHAHVHDDHHRHDHDAPVPDTPHIHWHRHAAMTHRHPHFPDAHHRHDHP
ncbi:DMT family transporter [Phaeospirillum tilakii]|uniref:DMT family transporter n=1 Tax=Phaeospirillum tilakii TaxID=741673 RepID=A0ABW5CEU1_9PROT